MSATKVTKKQAEEQKSVPVSFRIRFDLLKRLREEAKTNYRSITSQLTLILDKFFAEKGGK